MATGSRARADEIPVWTVDDWNVGKQHCVGCGGLRLPDYAEKVPCGCCGSLGTTRYMPLFDENGELIPAEVAAEIRAAKRQKAAEAAPAAEVATVVEPPKQPKPKKPPKPAASATTTSMPAKTIDVKDLFLAALF